MTQPISVNEFESTVSLKDHIGEKFKIIGRLPAGLDEYDASLLMTNPKDNYCADSNPSWVIHEDFIECVSHYRNFRYEFGHHFVRLGDIVELVAIHQSENFGVFACGNMLVYLDNETVIQAIPPKIEINKIFRK
jgi:hypothetical protein